MCRNRWRPVSWYANIALSYLTCLFRLKINWLCRCAICFIRCSHSVVWPEGEIAFSQRFQKRRSVLPLQCRRVVPAERIERVFQDEQLIEQCRREWRLVHDYKCNSASLTTVYERAHITLRVQNNAVHSARTDRWRPVSNSVTLAQNENPPKCSAQPLRSVWVAVVGHSGSTHRRFWSSKCLLTLGEARRSVRGLSSNKTDKLRVLGLSDFILVRILAVGLDHCWACLFGFRFSDFRSLSPSLFPRSIKNVGQVR